MTWSTPKSAVSSKYQTSLEEPPSSMSGKHRKDLLWYRCIFRGGKVCPMLISTLCRMQAQLKVSSEYPYIAVILFTMNQNRLRSCESIQRKVHQHSQIYINIQKHQKGVYHCKRSQRLLAAQKTLCVTAVLDPAIHDQPVSFITRKK